MTLPHAEILEYAADLEKQGRSFKKDILKICWYMRGISPADAMLLSTEDREIIGEIIKENLDITKKSGLPFF